MKHEIDLPDLPDGFEYTGEWREPSIDEWFVNADEVVCLCEDDEMGSYPIIKKTAPATLLSRIEKEYGEEYSIRELEWKEITNLSDGRELTNVFLCLYGRCHTEALSMKGFYRYVYENVDGSFYDSNNPTSSYNNETYTPVASLFTK